MLQRNPHTLAEAKIAARDMEHIERDYERLWRKEYELIPQFTLPLPKTVMDPTRPLNRPPYVFIEAALLPLAVTAPRTDPQIEEVEQCLGDSQLRFQEAMLK